MLVSDEKRSGIYMIRNTVNNKVYVGRTKSFYNRSRQYVYDFENRKIGHINEHMIRSMLKYGFHVFEFVIVEYCNEVDCPERELFWMKYYNSTNRSFGYNKRMDVDGVMVTHLSTSMKISERLRNEWGSGKRSSHSNKMRESWLTRDREAQSSIMTANLTKWVYEVSDDNDVYRVYYSELKEMGLQGVIGKFARLKTNRCIFKGVTIERFGI